MKAFTPYLNFAGNTKEAMTFYQHCLGAGAELDIKTFGDHAPSPGLKDGVMHARLSKNTMVLMASDSMPDQPLITGNNVWITQECDSLEEIDNTFAAFSEGGHVIMPLATQFWGARFGMLTDKFGINWMFNFEMQEGK